MSKFYNKSLDKVPNSGGSVRLTISSNAARQTTSTPCKRVWIIASKNDIRVKFGSACTVSTGIPVPPWGTTAQSVWHSPLMLEIDDISELYFYGATDAQTVDILYRE